MRIRHRLVAAIRRESDGLAAIAAESQLHAGVTVRRRAVQAESVRAAPSFRPLTEPEIESILGADLVAVLAAYAGTIR